jgi:hypothetical protein
LLAAAASRYTARTGRVRPAGTTISRSSRLLSRPWPCCAAGSAVPVAGQAAEAGDPERDCVVNGQRRGCLRETRSGSASTVATPIGEMITRRAACAKSRGSSPRPAVSSRPPGNTAGAFAALVRTNSPLEHSTIRRAEIPARCRSSPRSRTCRRRRRAAARLTPSPPRKLLGSCGGNPALPVSRTDRIAHRAASRLLVDGSRTLRRTGGRLHPPGGQLIAAPGSDAEA